MVEVPTSDALRKAIDEGRTGDKFGFPDPAAAPLGTDAEAGGTPPTQRDLARESARIGRPRMKPQGRWTLELLLYPAIVLPLCLIILAVIAWAALSR